MKPMIVKLERYNLLDQFSPLKRRITSAQFIVISFVTIILAGAILLTLPISSSSRTPQPFIDALFTSTSAISTTGLVVVDTGSFYSLFGQIVILILIQIGGLGYMIFIVSAAYALKKRISLNTQLLAQESLVGASFGEMKKIVQATVIYTLIFELGSAVILTLYWLPKFSMPKAIYLGVFHSVSAFATAGFGLFPDSFMSYQSSILINIAISITCIAGAIGFFVLYDIDSLFRNTIKKIYPRRLSTHTKLALLVSAILIVIGSAVIFISESTSSQSSFGQRALTSAFQAISAATTTGFNSVDTGAMTSTSLFLIIILMFIGSSPGGTGGGIKTTTFGVMIASALALSKGKQDINLFKRRVSYETVNKALAISMFAILVVITGTLILTATEAASFIKILFEVVSAFGTVGLSAGITPALSVVGKIVITVIMLIGRVGPLAIGFALFGRAKPAAFKYATGNVFVG